MPRFDRATVDVRVEGVNPYGPVAYRVRLDSLEDFRFVLEEATRGPSLKAMAHAAEVQINREMDASEPQADAVAASMLEAMKGALG